MLRSLCLQQCAEEEAKRKQLDEALQLALSRTTDANGDTVKQLQATIESISSQLEDAENEYDLLSEVRACGL